MTPVSKQRIYWEIKSISNKAEVWSIIFQSKKKNFQKLVPLSVQNPNQRSPKPKPTIQLFYYIKNNSFFLSTITNLTIKLLPILRTTLTSVINYLFKNNSALPILPKERVIISNWRATRIQGSLILVQHTLLRTISWN